jgi:hypothetical protein
MPIEGDDDAALTGVVILLAAPAIGNAVLLVAVADTESTLGAAAPLIGHDDDGTGIGEAAATTAGVLAGVVP